MAKSKNKKNSGKGSSKTPAQRAADTRKANRAAAAAKEARRKERQRISSAISYRNKRLTNNVTVLKDDAPQRKKYLRELRALYKEQNPKNNKKITKREEIHYENFRNMAKVHLKDLLSVSEETLKGYSKSQRKAHISKVKYYKELITHTTEKVLKDEEPEFVPVPSEPTPVDQNAELLDAEYNLLYFQAHEMVLKLSKSEFFLKLLLYINSDFYKEITLTKSNRLEIGIEFMSFTTYVRHHFCDGGTVKYDVEAYSNGAIIATAYCTKHGKKV